MTTVNPTRVRFPIHTQLTTGEPVDWRELEVKIEGPAQITDLGIGEENGQVLISFMASVIGTYKCIVTHNDLPLKNTPINISFSPKLDNAPTPVPTLPAAAVPKSRVIRFNVPSNTQHSDLSAWVAEGPDPNPSELVATVDGNHISVRLQISKPGDYKIGIQGSNDSEPIPGSPFSITVPASVFDPI